jgi:hypothetical protein
LSKRLGGQKALTEKVVAEMKSDRCGLLHALLQALPGRPLGASFSCLFIFVLIFGCDRGRRYYDELRRFIRDGV